MSDYNVGDRIIYKPATRRHGISQDPKRGIILAKYEGVDLVRIKCERENIQRIVRINKIERDHGADRNSQGADKRHSPTHILRRPSL